MEVLGYNRLKEKGLVKDIDVAGKIPEGFGSHLKMVIKDGKVTGLSRELSKSDQPFILSYLRFLEKEMGGDPNNVSQVRHSLNRNHMKVHMENICDAKVNEAVVQWNNYTQSVGQKGEGLKKIKEEKKKNSLCKQISG